eukprot:TRINITY_DN304_c0_g1_i1.p1 TRINITY_DN304_c0_g1~~TRINITY_DN304_c0_g1_i1.p1  ORF type:complete len:941 (+),score=359.93 TRINITY_DN304_c0_g1_i1:73-2895(+)
MAPKARKPAPSKVKAKTKGDAKAAKEEPAAEASQAAAEAAEAAEAEKKEDAAMKAEEEVKKEEKVEAKEEGGDVAMDDVKAEAAAEDGGAEGDAPMEEEEPAPVEEVKKFEEETDAPEDKRPKVDAGKVCLSMVDCTPNVMTALDGRLVTSLCEGGMQYLTAGVRSTAGVKAGRYFFEVKIVESLEPENRDVAARGRPRPPARHLLKVGFTAGGSHLMDDAVTSTFVGFDNEGTFIAGKQLKPMRRRRVDRLAVVGVMVNMVEGSEHQNTISMFVDGERVSEPQKLPETACGKALFPTILFKNSTLQVNFGPAPKKALPFNCRMLRDAAAADLELVTAPSGKPEVVFPVGIPEQGVFDFVDLFSKNNPKYMEVSERKWLEWMRRSDVVRQRGWKQVDSQDRPGMNTGLFALDDRRFVETLANVVPMMHRDILVMDLEANLQPNQRKLNLRRYPATDFKRVALVAVGEPTAEYKEYVQGIMLEDKKRSSELAKRKAAAEERRKAKKAGTPRKDSEATEEKKEEGVEDDAEKAEDEEKKEEEEEPPKDDAPVELTEDEKKQAHRTLKDPELGRDNMSHAFASFALPAAEEGFDEVRYVWKGADESLKLFKDWLMEQKKTQRIEDLKPGKWFQDHIKSFDQQVKEWRKKADEAKRASKKPAEKKEDKEEGAEGEGEEAAAEEFDEEDVDVMTTENIDDMGNGKPIYHAFQYEDWRLLALRHDLHLMLHAFRKDVNDADRESFHQKHLTHYFRVYYKEFFDVKNFACKDLAELLELIPENVTLDEETSFLKVVLPEDTPLEKFIRLTEEHRRDRQRSIDAGDEGARLKFPAARPQSFAAPSKGDRGPPGGERRGDKGGGGGKGGGRDRDRGRRDDRGKGGKRGASFPPVGLPGPKIPRLGGGFTGGRPVPMPSPSGIRPMYGGASLGRPGPGPSSRGALPPRRR